MHTSLVQNSIPKMDVSSVAGVSTDPAKVAAVKDNIAELVSFLSLASY